MTDSTLPQPLAARTKRCIQFRNATRRCRISFDMSQALDSIPMTHLPLGTILFFLLPSVSACVAGGPPSLGAAVSTQGPPTKRAAQKATVPTSQEHGTAPYNSAQPSRTARPATVRLVSRAQAGRAAEILDGRGVLIQTFFPEEFSQVLVVPDIAGNSSKLIPLRVPGTDMVAASVEEGTGRVLLAVRGFLYAEVSTDLVFVLVPASSEGEEPFTILPVYFDGPQASQEEQGARPHLDISRAAFGAGGTLELETADASGGASKLVYNSDRTPKSCVWQSGESQRCPRGSASETDGGAAKNE